MRPIILSISVAVILAGCRSADDDFVSAKRYLDSRKPNAFDPGQFFPFAKRIYEREDAISFLIDMTKGEDPKDVILACMLLTDLLDQVNRQPTPQGEAFVREIQPVELREQMQRFKTNSLDNIWQHWFSSEQTIIEMAIESGRRDL